MAGKTKRPILIGIAGGSGSGKTHVARQIRAQAGEEHVALLSMDQYFCHRASPDSQRQVNFDHPAHIDFVRLIRDIKTLKRGKAVNAPDYSFESMASEPDAVRISPKTVVLVEGLFVLADPIHHLFDLTCFLDVAADQRLLGRILRDSVERAASIPEIVDRYQRFVRPAYDVFVAPTMHNADIVVDFTYRRALFTEMLAHIARDYAVGDLDIEPFLARVRRESFHMGYRPEEGTMPITVDIFKLAKAYPPSLLPTGVPTEPPTHPRLFLHNHGSEP